MKFDLLFGYMGDDGQRDRCFGWVLAWWKSHFPDVHVCMGRNFDKPFHRGRARNDAFESAVADLIIVADADTVPNSDAIRAALLMVDIQEAPWVLPYGEERYYNLSENETDRILKSDPTADLLEPSDPEQWEHKITSWAGCLVMHRTAWNELGGYDERFEGWGYEDNAFRLALDTLAGPHKRIDSYVSHLWHPIAPGTTFDSPTIGQNRTLFRAYERALGNETKMRKVLADGE